MSKSALILILRDPWSRWVFDQKLHFFFNLLLEAIEIAGIFLSAHFSMHLFLLKGMRDFVLQKARPDRRDVNRVAKENRFSGVVCDEENRRIKPALDLQHQFLHLDSDVRIE